MEEKEVQQKILDADGFDLNKNVYNPLIAMKISPTISLLYFSSDSDFKLTT